MYSILSCPEGQPLADESAPRPDEGGLVLHLRENRSGLSQQARIAFTALISLFMAAAILPAFRGELLTPIFSLTVMGLLVAAIDWHKRSRPASEWLSIENQRLRYASDRHAPIDWPIQRTRLVKDDTVPARLRLFLESHWHKVEIGHCLSLDEKRALASLLAPRLCEVRS